MSSPSDDSETEDVASRGGGPVIHYSRAALLALYDSPLVPKSLSGMKSLVEWYGEYTDLPSSPPQNHRHHLLHSELSSRPLNSASSSSTSSAAAALRAANNARPNPFANFGRFGVDGGLEEVPSSITATGAKKGAGGGRDPAPHISSAANGALEGKPIGARRGGGASPERERAERGGAKYGVSPRDGAYFSNERDRTDRMSRARGDGERTTGRERGDPITGGRERRERDDTVKKEGRAEEGGWRTSGTSDRDRRLGGGRNGTSGRDGREGALSSGDSRNGPRSARPAWMDDEPSTASSSTPAWMDAPVSGTGLAFGATPAAGGGDGGDGGMDSIQAFKAQMKEEERRRNAPTASRRDSDRRDSDDADDGRPSKANGLTIDLPTNSHPLAVAVDGSSPVPPSSNHDGASGGVLRPAVDGLNDDFTIPASNESRPSVFENLGLRNGASRPPAEKVRGGRGGGGGEGQGRSSRFAKFFDAGKPQTPSAAAPPPQPHSIFSELMGGMAKPKSGPEPSREDQESMARLLGMLQISGQTRETSPVMTKSAPPPAPLTQPPVPAPADPRGRQGSAGGSRFAFSQQPQQSPNNQPPQPPQTSPPQLPPQSAPQQQPPPSLRFAQQPLGSPPVQYGNPQQPFPYPSHHPQVSPSLDGRGQFSSPPALHQRGQSNGAPLAALSSPPPGSLPPNQPQYFAPQQSPYAPPPPHLLSPGRAPLPPPGMNLRQNDYPGQSLPGPQLQQQQHGMPPIPMSMGPRSLPPQQQQMYQPGFSLPPPPPGMRPPGPPLPPPGGLSFSRPGGFAPPPPQMGGGGGGGYGPPPPPQGYPFPQGGRGPPPMGMPGMGYAMGPGVPDLMSLLNGGGGGGGMRPGMGQQRPGGPDMRQYME